MRKTGLPRAKGKPALPTISDYLDAFCNPYGRFRTLGETEPMTNPRGEILFYAGNNAAVFPLTMDQRRISLKCYIKYGLHTEDIYLYLSGRTDPLLTPVRLLRDEIFVYDIFGNGRYYDAVAAEWVEGVTLETAIRRAARNDGFTFGNLSSAFCDTALELLRREWAHGDLKPENIIVRLDGSLCLIDYDAMFIPELAGRRTLEVGTPPYQHPARDEILFDKSIDDYPIALIASSLRALSLDPSLYARYNRTDNITLYPSEIIGGVSEAYSEMLHLFAHRGDHASYNLALSLRNQSPHIDDLERLLTSCTDHRGWVAIKTGSASITSEPVRPGSNLRSTACEVVHPEPFLRNGLWGYADESGREVIPAVYETTFEFSEGSAVVKIDGIWQVIDKTGTVTLECSGYDAVKPFSEGLAPVCKNGAWGYITPQGRMAVEPRFEMAGIVREGMAVVKTGGKYGYIGSDGRIAVEPVYDYATGFRNGRATVSIGGETFEIVMDSVKNRHYSPMT